MMYLRSMIVLTLLVSIIGLALPSDHGSSAMTQQKIAKGSKKNPPLFRQKIPVSIVVTQAMAVQRMEDTVTKVVRNILTGQQQNDNDRNLAPSIFPYTRVEITGTTQTKCEEQYPKDIRCYDATVTIASKAALVDRILQLTEALDGVIRIENGSIAVTQQRRGGWFHYPYVKVTNKTPYDTLQYYGLYSNYGISVMYYACSPDSVLESVASGDTWTASSRGLCLVTNIYTTLTIPDSDYPGTLTCKEYHSSGTSYSQYSIIMDGEDACCVKSSHEKPQTC